MHLGTPVIARRNAGNSSLITDGENGLLFDNLKVCIYLLNIKSVESVRKTKFSAACKGFESKNEFFTYLCVGVDL